MDENNEQTQDQTYAYEQAPISEKLLETKKEELKVLKKKAETDRIVRLENKAKKRIIRDNNIDKINLRLKTIKKQMVKYNRAGKLEKSRIDILGNIKSLIESDVELLEEIEKSKQVSQEEIESEAVDESEVSIW